MSTSPVRRYALTLPGPPGGHAPPTVVVVSLTETHGPNGGRVWADPTGEWRVQIISEAATVLAAPAGYAGHRCLHAVPMP
ncbi:DUF6296 family protein [Streptomyces sp. NPDC001667]